MEIASSVANLSRSTIQLHGIWPEAEVGRRILEIEHAAREAGDESIPRQVAGRACRTSPLPNTGIPPIRDLIELLDHAAAEHPSRPVMRANTGGKRKQQENLCEESAVRAAKRRPRMRLFMVIRPRVRNVG